MWNWPNRLGFAANVGLFLMVAYFIGRHGLEAPSADWKYTDLVTIILTALGVILAALALGIGILAIWGYQKIADHAVQESVKVVNKRLDDMLREQNLKQRIVEIVQPHIQQAADEVWGDFAAAAYPADGDEDNAGRS